MSELFEVLSEVKILEFSISGGFVLFFSFLLSLLELSVWAFIILALKNVILLFKLKHRIREGHMATDQEVEK